MDEQLFDKLLRHRAVPLGEIDEKSAAQVALGLLRLQLNSSRPAYLLIDSGGGSLRQGLALHDLICYGLQMPVHALVMGRCNSAATFVLLACERRMAMPHAEFVIHSGTFSNISLKTDDVTQLKVERLLNEMKKNTAMVIDFYAQKLKKPEEEIKKLIARGDEEFDNALSATEAVDIGLITEIASKKIELFPPPDPNTSCETA